MTTSRRAFAFSFLSQYLAIGIQFVTVIVISRLLTPNEIGIFSIAAALVTLGHMLRDFGVGQYIIQETELTTERIRSAFTSTLVLGWLVAAGIFLLAPVAGEYYADEGVEQVLTLLSLNFVLLPFGSVTMALLQRDLRFGKLGIAKVSSQIVSSMVAISSAFEGLSYLSLAWGSIAGVCVTILFAALFRPSGMPWLPGGSEIPRVLAFGWRMVASTGLGQIATVGPELILGKLQDMTSVGLFSRAQGTISLFARLVTNSLHSVLTPLFAKQHREHGSLTDSFIYGIACITGIAWPFYLGMAMLAHELIFVLYGEAWLPTAPLVRILAVSMLIKYLTFFTDNIAIATGNIGRLARLQSLLVPAQLVVVFVSAPYGLTPVVWGLALFNLARFIFYWRLLRRMIRFQMHDYLSALLKSIWLAAGTLAGVGTALTLEPFSVTENVIGKLFACILGGLLGWAIVLAFSAHPLRHEAMRIAANVKSKLPVKRGRS